VSALGAELFALVAAGKMRPSIGMTVPLSSAREAHDALQQRSTTGKLLLQVPQ
jgi:NADPH2:quinone reductase